MNLHNQALRLSIKTKLSDYYFYFRLKAMLNRIIFKELSTAILMKTWHYRQKEKKHLHTKI
jgi:hypothetical protein